MGSTRDPKAVAAERLETIRQAVTHLENTDRRALLRQIARLGVRDHLRDPEALVSQLRSAMPNAPEFYGCWSVARSLLRVAQGAPRDERIARLSLAHVYGAGATAGLLKGQSAAAVVRGLCEISDQGGFGRQAFESIASFDGARLLARAEADGARFLVPDDVDWPETLRVLGEDAPLGLWVRGTASLAELAEKAVAVTGSRAASDYGKHVAGYLAGGLADQKVTVVSAIGQGADGAALMGALVRGEAAAPPIGVHAGGVAGSYGDGVLRQEQAILSAGGLIVSLCAPGVPLSSARANQRQRLMAALASAVVVVEAGLDSRAVSTPQVEGRPLLAVPGPITSSESAGTNTLIRDGAAQAVMSADDITAALARH
ncbi:DNA-protecting protein DprA [Streptomyces cellulosae]|uniref:DNA-protecting protein DprA n=1 Tax=Streptomyces althioticus TaxID=83380 RepID=A0ABZ1YI69_9ACTN|nr:DNA-protecting protein DprA [Streptomyces cellulosae]WTB86610.1 DNA-protecting protein DprA [Streptomyces cellulosae]WTB93425.1 DNA-protecting protein DprA [Streptomyces cellulosae]WTC60816.1 DNA-protecting protein DprA [Streptomyces cellulosae]